MEGGHERERNRYNFIPGFSPALPAASVAAIILQQGTFDGPVTPPALRTLCEALSRSCQDQVLGAYDFIPGLPGVMSSHTITTPFRQSPSGQGLAGRIRVLRCDVQQVSVCDDENGVRNTFLTKFRYDDYTFYNFFEIDSNIKEITNPKAVSKNLSLKVVKFIETMK